jgi:hypothetical protein
MKVTIVPAILKFMRKRTHEYAVRKTHNVTVYKTAISLRECNANRDTSGEASLLARSDTSLDGVGMLPQAP